MKGIFLDTNLSLLGLTVFVSFFHVSQWPLALNGQDFWAIEMSVMYATLAKAWGGLGMSSSQVRFTLQLSWLPNS